MTAQKIVLVSCGSFNPITKMHLKMFECAKDFLHKSGQYKVIKGILSPVHDEYKRKNLIPSQHRIQMCRLAAQSSGWIEVDDWESKQSGWSRTLDVLRHFAKSENDTTGQSVRVMFLCGSDVLETFAIPNLWKSADIEEILQRFGMVVLRRNSSDDHKLLNVHPVVEKNKQHLHLLDAGFDNNISSTLVRAAIQKNESIKNAVEEDVVKYIEEHRLYR